MAISFKATLRVLTTESDSVALDNAFGVSCDKFSPVIVLDSKMRRQPSDKNYWKLDFPGGDGESESEITLDEVLSLLEKRKNEIENLKHRIVSIDIFCFFSTDNGQGGFALKSELINRMSRLNIDLLFDIYS